MTVTEMRIQDPSVEGVIKESEVYNQLLPLDGAHIIELGCGGAIHTRAIAESGRPASILACEVDTIQHEKNLAITDLPTVTFCHAGAEAIPAEDSSADIVMMFKSLHHVPLEAMDKVIQEIRRVLKPGGLAYISEPVYAGDFNEVLRFFTMRRLYVRQPSPPFVKRSSRAYWNCQDSTFLTHRTILLTLPTSSTRLSVLPTPITSLARIC